MAPKIDQSPRKKLADSAGELWLDFGWFGVARHPISLVRVGGVVLLMAGLGLMLSWQGPWQLAAVAGTFVVGQMAEGLFITPKVVGDKVGLSSVAVIIAILAFLGIPAALSRWITELGLTRAQLGLISSFGGVTYSVPHQLVDETVWVRFDGDVRGLPVGLSRPARRARATPGRCAVGTTAASSC